jgi:hypothetical protein
MTISITILSLMALSIMTVSKMTLRIAEKSCHLCHIRYAECRNLTSLLRVTMLSVIILSVVVLSVIMPNVDILSVAAFVFLLVINTSLKCTKKTFALKRSFIKNYSVVF